MRHYAPQLALGFLAVAVMSTYAWNRSAARANDSTMRHDGANLALLSAAFASGNIEQARAVIDRNPDCRRKADWLAMPAVLGQRATVRYLLKSGWSPDGLRGDGTPLLMCGRMGNLEAARALVAAGADVEVKTSEGHTPLMQAARDGLSGLCDLLLDSGANVNATADPKAKFDGPVPSGWEEDRCALHMAVRHDDPQIVAQLLKHGADASIRTRLGQTALELARALSHNECADLLSKGTKASKLVTRGGTGADLARAGSD